MAYNYCEFSVLLPVPEDKQGNLVALVDEMTDKYYGCQVEVVKDGVWFSAPAGDGDIKQVAEIAEHIINALQLPEPFYVSYAYWCDKPRLDEFGGGAFVVELGKETIWCDPEQYLRHLKLNEQDAKEYYFTLTSPSIPDNLRPVYLDGTKAFVWETRIEDMQALMFPEKEILLKIQGEDKTWYEKYTDGTLVMTGENNDIELCDTVGDVQEAP